MVLWWNQRLEAISMNTSPIASSQNTFAALRRLARKRPDAEQCEFCNALVAPEHRHS